ncbi:MAG: universal stress protein [Phycisphaerae bacterium]|nr:universal stress protein [Phycisphaerae bacterium]
MINIRQILFPTDFSDLSLYVLKYAVDFARSYAATLHLLHVVDDAYRYIVSMGPDSVPVGPPPEDLINAATREMQAFVAEHLPDPPFEVKTDVVAGRPFMEIIQYARDHEIDMIVIGTHGRSGLTHVLLGSVAEKVVRKAPCPVLSIRHPDQRFVMP